MNETDSIVMGQRYAIALEAYLAAVGEAIRDVVASQLPSARLEHHFECFKDWSLFGSCTDVEQWFLDQRARCPMHVEEIPLRECRAWSVDATTSNIQHESGDFFRVHGVRVSSTGSREVGVSGWDQPIVTQVGFDGGLLGLLRKRFHGIPHYLVEAKAEPGNYEKLQLSPTLQATFANLRQAHRGRKPRFAELFEEPEANGATVLYRAWLSEDGGRLYLKRNCAMLIEVGAVDIEVPSGFRWVSMFQLKALLHQNAWVNPHVRGIIAHL